MTRPMVVSVIEPGRAVTRLRAKAAHVIHGVLVLHNPLQDYDPPRDDNGTQYLWPAPGTVVFIKDERPNPPIKGQ